MKYLTSILTASALFIATALPAMALGLVSIRTQSPDTPTNQKEFKLSFVSMDFENRPISVKCFVKGPSAGSFTQFDSTKSLPSGGTSGHCQVTSAQINQAGSYQFYTTAQAGVDSAQSNTVTVDYSSAGPGTPTDYSREKVADCTYRIRFKTANDSKTAKVEIFRSTSPTFDLNSGTKIGEVALGPNQAGEYTSNPPDCGTTYYYAIRSVDNAGNVSSPVGDSQITATTTATTATTPSLGAIPVTPSTTQISETEPVQGSILGETDAATPAAAATPASSPETSAAEGAVAGLTQSLSQTNTKIGLAVLAILAGVILFTLSKRRQQY